MDIFTVLVVMWTKKQNAEVEQLSQKADYLAFVQKLSH